MMNDLPFGKPGRFYKGNLHAHSTESDGARSPEEVAQIYHEAGYDFLAITDHFLKRYGFPITDTRPFRTEGFTTLLGAELHAPKTELGDDWHIVAVGLPPSFAPTVRGETGPELAERAAGAGAFVAMAHPAGLGLTVRDAESLGAAHAVEVHNETAAWYDGRADGWYLCDALAAGGRRVGACASDDAHFGDRPDSLAAWVMVRAEAPQPEALLEALKAGRYYSSQGPEIHDVRVENGRVAVRCSLVRAVFVTGRGATARSSLGEGIEERSFPVEPFVGSYLRVTVVNSVGGRAWSNPVFLG